MHRAFLTSGDQKALPFPTDGSDGPIIQLRDGSALICVYGRSPEAKHDMVAFCRSADSGNSWELLSTLSTDHETSETSVTQLPDGRLVLISRPEGDIAWSADGGRSWTQPVSFGIRLFEPRAARFACGCSEERIGNALRLLGRAEVDGILAEQGGIAIENARLLQQTRNISRIFLEIASQIVASTDNLIEVSPSATIAALFDRRRARGYKRDADPWETRAAIIESLSDLEFAPGSRLAREDVLRNDHCFDAVIDAYTAYLWARDGWRMPEPSSPFADDGLDLGAAAARPARHLRRGRSAGGAPRIVGGVLVVGAAAGQGVAAALLE